MDCHKSSWSTYPCSFWKEIGYYPKEAFMNESECSPVANQLSKPINVTQEGMAAADNVN